jgi:hypothetical protein
MSRFKTVTVLIIQFSFSFSSPKDAANNTVFVKNIVCCFKPLLCYALCLAKARWLRHRNSQNKGTTNKRKGKEGKECGRMRQVKLGVLCAAWLVVQAVAFAPSGMVLRCRSPSVRLIQQILLETILLNEVYYGLFCHILLYSEFISGHSEQVCEGHSICGGRHRQRE